MWRYEKGIKVKECRSYSVRGLVEVLLQRSEMTGDGTLVMETIGQIPGSCEELFGQRGNGESELVGASQEWLGKEGMSFFFSGFVSVEDKDGDQRCETESCYCSTKKSGSHMLGGCWQGGGHLCPFVTGQSCSARLW